MEWDRTGTLCRTSFGEYAIHQIGKGFYLDFGGSVTKAKAGKTLGRFDTKRATVSAAEDDYAQRLSDELDCEAVSQRTIGLRLAVDAFR